MRIAFLGASDFGFKCLEIITKIEGINICGVISNLRTFKISYNQSGVDNILYEDFESFCNINNIPFYRMSENMREANLKKFLIDCHPDLVVVIGWYHLIPKSLLANFTFVGIHASLLPDYSGGAPLVWAIINGEKKTGITLFYFDEGVDSGDIIGQEEITIEEDDTIKSLYLKVEISAKKMILDMLPKLAQGKAPRIKQDESKRRIFPQRRPEDGLIDWEWDAGRLKNFIRAQTRPYPGAWTIINQKKVIIWDADISEV